MATLSHVPTTNRLWIATIAVLVGILLLVAGLFAMATQREAERDACRDLSAYVDC